MGNPLVDIVVAAIAFLIAMVTIGLLARSSPYDRIGSGRSAPLAADTADPPAGSEAAQRLREVEMRQMLQARNDRRARAGQAPVDVEQELQRLVGGTVQAGGEDRAEDHAAIGHDPELVQEMRQLATARSRRRVQRGEPPLDIEQEVRRALAELDL